MDILEIYLLNVLITIGLFIATLYRIKIEHRMAKNAEEDAKAKKILKKLLYTLDNEKDIVDNCSGKEIRKMLRESINKELSEL